MRRSRGAETRRAPRSSRRVEGTLRSGSVQGELGLLFVSACLRSRVTRFEPRPAMRIGIDGSCLANRRGFGRFARRLLEALARQATHASIRGLRRPAVGGDGRGARGGSSGSSSTWARRRAGRRRPRGGGGCATCWPWAGRSRVAGSTSIYFPATYSFFPVWNVGRLVVTMHDTLALSHPELVFPRLGGRIAWRLKEHAAARWADRIVTVSEASRRAILAGWAGPTRGSGSSPRAPTRSSGRGPPAPSRTPCSAGTGSGRASVTCSTSAA